MKRKLKQGIRRSINRTRKTVFKSCGAAAFLGVYFAGFLPGLEPEKTDAFEYSAEHVRSVGYENYVSSRKLKTEPYFAHRGYSAKKLENSFQAFDLARTSGYPQIECDIWKSTDGILYVSHDNSLGRTADSELKITESSSEQLDQVSLKNGDRLPRLSDLFERYGNGLVYLIELKEGGSELDSFLDLMGRYEGLQKNILVQAWNLDALNRVHEKLPYMFTMLLMPDTGGLSEALANPDLSGVNISQNALNPETVSEIRKAGKACWGYTANTEQEISRLKDLGVDGVISDYPDKVEKILASSDSGA